MNKSTTSPIRLVLIALLLAGLAPSPARLQAGDTGPPARAGQAPAVPDGVNYHPDLTYATRGGH